MSFEVSVIIVNWNSKNYLKETIDSLYAFTKDINFELILIDNNSNKDDESYKFIENELPGYANAKIILNTDNPGFAKANNKGIDISIGKYILLLNPDVSLKTNLLKILFDYIEEHPEIGMIGPKVLNTDETFQSSCMRGEPDPKSVLYKLIGINKLFKNSPKYNQFSLDHLDNNEINEIAGLSGCCMMIRREVIEQIGKMDESFFLYQEETDWCLRAYKVGWKIIYNPKAVIIHHKGVTTKQVILKSNYIFCQSMMILFKKHYFAKYNFFEKSFFIALIWLNFFLKYFQTLVYYNTKPKNQD